MTSALRWNRRFAGRWGILELWSIFLYKILCLFHFKKCKITIVWLYFRNAPSVRNALHLFYYLQRSGTFAVFCCLQRWPPPTALNFTPERYWSIFTCSILRFFHFKKCKITIVWLYFRNAPSARNALLLFYYRQRSGIFAVCFAFFKDGLLLPLSTSSRKDAGASFCMASGTYCILKSSR